MLDQLLKCISCKKDLGYHVPRNPKEAESEVTLKLLCVRCYCKQNGIKVPRKYGGAISWLRNDIDSIYSFRSALEANFARILNHLKVKWTYENIKFKFDNYKTTPYSYKPDFEIVSDTEESRKYGLVKGIYEIKGKIDRATLTKLKRLKDCYPNDYQRLIVVPAGIAKMAQVETMGYTCIKYSTLKKVFHPIITYWE